MEVKLSDTDIKSIARELAAELRMSGDPSATTDSPPAADAFKLLWNEKEAAAVLAISPLTLKKWRLAGLVKSETTTRPVLYTREQLEAAAATIVRRTQEPLR